MFWLIFARSKSQKQEFACVTCFLAPVLHTLHFKSGHHYSSVHKAVLSPIRSNPMRFWSVALPLLQHQQAHSYYHQVIHPLHSASMTCLLMACVLIHRRISTTAVDHLIDAHNFRVDTMHAWVVSLPVRRVFATTSV